MTMLAEFYVSRIRLYLLAGALAGLLPVAVAGPVAGHLAAPAGLRCDGLTEPLAVADANPMFSWSVAAATPGLRGVRQQAYEIRVLAGQATLWESGKVEGSSASGIAYAGPVLEAQHTYAWQVRIWDEGGRATAWSRMAHWTQAPVFTAQWIGADATDADAVQKPLPLFRKGFKLTAGVKRAVLYASGLGQDELRINGRKVGNDELTPGWSDYRKTVYYDSYDVTALLHEGANALGVMVGNGMYSVLKTPGRYTKFVGSYGPPKCIAQLSIEMVDGARVEIASDGTWKTAPGPITFSSTYGGEDFDARREPEGWDRAGFNDSKWGSVLVTANPGGVLRPEAAPAIRVMHTYLPVKKTEPKPGVEVYDLGQNFAGWPEITVQGAAGAAVKLTPGELLEKDGTVSQKSSGRPQWFSYTLKGGGVERWHPRFSYYGFRYVQVEGKAHLLALRGAAVHTSSAAVGSFASSDNLLNRIHTLIVRSVENNAVSLFTDCPHREKLGWLEETHLMAPSILYDFDFAGLFAATAQNIADEQRQDGEKAGKVAEIAPQYVVFDPQHDGAFDDSPEWGSAAVLAPWYVFERTGDKRFLEAQLDVMRGYTGYLGRRAKEGIVAYGLGDWYDIGPGGPGMSKLTTAGVTGTAVFYQDLRVLEKATALAGLKDESQSYREKAVATRANFNARFFNAERHWYDKGSQTAQAMALALGLVAEGERGQVLDALVQDIRAHGNHVTAGDVGYHYVVDALMEGGRQDVLLDMLERTDTPSYGYQLAQGATALTEAWDANPSSSQDHFMLGHAEEWFYRGLGGIGVDMSQAVPRQIVIAPSLEGKIGWVRCRYVSALGPIESNWRRGAKESRYDLVVPANAEATVELETALPEAVKVDGMPAARARGVQGTAVKGNGLELVLSSGSYHIVAANPAANPAVKRP